MARYGVDWSSKKRPDLKAFTTWPDGKVRDFVVRYLSDLGNPKNLTRPEADYWRKQHIDIAVVFETTAGRAKMGSAAGIIDAKKARQQVIAYGGPADGGVIYFAVDFDASREDQGMINGYFEGIRTVLPHANIGAYGGYNVITRLFDAKLINWAFQTLAWSGGHEHPRTNIYQYAIDRSFGGTMVDFDQALTANFGQWDYADDGELVMDAEAKAAFAALSARIDAVGAYVMNAKDDTPAHAGLVDIYKVARRVEDMVAAPVSEGTLSAHQSRTEDAIKHVLSLKKNLQPPHGAECNDRLGAELVLHTLTAEMKTAAVHNALDSHAGNIVTKLDTVQTPVMPELPPPVNLKPVLSALAGLKASVDALPKTDATPAVAAAMSVGTTLERALVEVRKDLAALPKTDPAPAVKAMRDIGATLETSIAELRADLAALPKNDSKLAVVAAQTVGVRLEKLMAEMQKELLSVPKAPPPDLGAIVSSVNKVAKDLETRLGQLRMTIALPA